MIYLLCLDLPYPKIHLLPRMDYHNVVVDEKFGDVALHAMGRCNIWVGFLTSMNCVVTPGHMRVILVVTAEGGGVKIQTLGVS